MILHADDQQLQQKHDQQSVRTHTSLPEPIVLTNDTKNLLPLPAPPLASPTNRRRRLNKRKKGGNNNFQKNKCLTKKIHNLTGILNLIPFIPKALDLDKHEDVLKRLGLYEFSKIELDRSIRTDLLVQLIVNYDSKKRCSYVNEKRINVSRAHLARALKLPATKQDKGNRKVEEVDLDSEVYSDEAIGFIEDFVFNWVLLHEESWIMPAEIVNWTRCIRDGHPEKLDSASLIWYKVEKELTQGDKLVDCYYASHLQYLIRSQKGQLLKEEDDGGGGVDEGEEIVKADEEQKEKEDEEKVSIVQKDEVELTSRLDVEETVHQEFRKVDETMVDVEECKEEMEEKVNWKNNLGEESVKDDEEHEEKVSIVQEDDVELTLGPDVEEPVHQEVRKDDEIMVDAEELKEEMEEQVSWKNDLGDEIVKDDEEHEEKVSVVQEYDVELTLGPDVEETLHQEVRKDDETMVEAEECKEEMEEQVHCKKGLTEPVLQRCQSSDLNGYEELKVEEVEDEQIEQVEDEDDEVEEEDAGERFVEGFDMEANDDSIDRDGLTDNLHHGVSSIDPFRSRDDSFMSHGGPSFFDNGGKRVLELEEDTHYLDGDSKRLKTDEMWDQKHNDFGICMMQMQQWMEKAKMIHESKEESFVNSQCHQDLAMNQLQERNQFMEMVIKSRNEELEKKNSEVFRLERELYLMEDLLAGYRKALNDTRFKFSEYRRRFVLQEEPLYKDVGPGGVVLSTQELERQRLKQEEDMMKIQIWAKSFEEECVYQLKLQGERVLKMAERLVFVGNEVERLKERATQREETQMPRDEVGLSPEPEENQKPHDEVPENDANMESVPPDDAVESEENGGGCKED